MMALLPPLTLSNDERQSLFDYRLRRIRAEMSRQSVSLCVLNSPISLRYAIDFDEYQLFQSHIPTCHLFLPLEGPLVMFGASARTFPHVEEYRPACFLTPFDGGLDLSQNSAQLSQTILDFLEEHRLRERTTKVALERISPLATQSLLNQGLKVIDGECLLEQAKLIKCELEIRCMRHAIAVAEYGMAQMQEALQPGVTENQLWSVLHQVNIAHGGDWIEGRMLASGPRTNPWLQEATHRVIQAGEMVAFDTDMIGPMGYIADISRSWLCGDGQGNDEQRAAYQHAYEEVQHNISLIKPGISFRELSEKAYQRAPSYIANRYVCVFHGAGLSDEYPKIYYQEDWQRSGYDGIVDPNMVLCVESYSGREGGHEGVKLEEMVLVTEDGVETLSHYPFEKRLLSDIEC